MNGNSAPQQACLMEYLRREQVYIAYDGCAHLEHADVSVGNPDCANDDNPSIRDRQVLNRDSRS